jgi:hypothetical protein
MQGYSAHAVAIWPQQYITNDQNTGPIDTVATSGVTAVTNEKGQTMTGMEMK